MLVVICCMAGIAAADEKNILVFVTSTASKKSLPLSPGKYHATCRIPGNLLNQGTYTIDRLLFVEDLGRIVFEHNDTLTFDVIMPDEGRFGWMGRKEGVVNPILDWTVSSINRDHG